MKRFLYENSLSIVLFGLFLLCLIGQVLTGQRSYNQDLESHGMAALSWPAYLTSGHFIEATFENWESEFLQMWALVLLTIFLRQKGSADSKKLHGAEAVDAVPGTKRSKNAPGPVKHGGWFLKIYQHSLSLALLALFIVAFCLHAAGGAREFSQEQVWHGEKPVSVLQFVGTTRFWFESFQNWQSEFLSVGALTVLAIFLRQKGSPQSKPVDAPHAKTGSD